MAPYGMNEQVLIVGAGPTGLVAALWLTKAGIPVRIIDKAEKSGSTSRALVFHARNLEFYRQMRIDRLAIENSIEFGAGNLWLRGRKVGRVPFGELGVSISKYPYALILPQDLHEAILAKHLEEQGIRVERSTELAGFASSPEGVVAELQKNGAESERAAYRFLLGCDGAHSAVREKLGVGFPGGTYSDTFYVADIEGSGPVMNGEMNGALDDADFLALFPMKGSGHARLVGAVRPEQKERRDLTWQDVSQGIISRLQLKIDKVKWFSTYRVHHRVASHFRKRQVFLLGDAAHLHSPVGGQGMNTGIGDAVNLAWKVAAVLKGDSPQKLLDTYESERIAFARNLVATTDRAFTFVSAKGTIARIVRLGIIPRILPFLFRFAFVRRAAFRILSQTSLKYRHSPISQGSVGPVRGGDRLPWVCFRSGPADLPDNYCTLSTQGWQVHVYGEPGVSVRGACEKWGVPCFVFPWEPAVRKAGLRRNACYLIRPDGYIGFAEPERRESQLPGYLENWMGTPQAKPLGLTAASADYA